MGHALLSHTQRRATQPNGIPRVNFRDFDRFFVEPGSKQLCSCVYVATETGIETFSEVAYNY